MRKGILSLMMPHQRKTKSKNIQLAEQKANGVAEMAAQEPLPPPQPQPQLELPAEEPFVQRVYVPKTPSLLKAVTKQHDEMVKRARRPTTT